MKYFIDAIAATLALNLKCITPRLVYASLMANARRKETPIHWSIARYLQQHGISMLLYLVAMLLGYDAAVELKIFAGIYNFLFSGICCVSLFFFFFFFLIQIPLSFCFRLYS